MSESEPLVVEIPGGTATLRRKLKERQRRLVEAAYFAGLSALSQFPPEVQKALDGGTLEAEVPITPAQAAALHQALLAQSDAQIIARLESWTLDAPLPASADDLVDLDAEVYAALKDAVDNGDFGPAQLDTSVTPLTAEYESSPTPGSSSSEEPSPETSAPASDPTSSSPSATAPTATADSSPA